MTISYEWLLEYLPVQLPVDELCNILTSIGLEVEGTERTEAIPGGLEGLVIGEVLTREKHPNADKLSVTTVDVGTGTPLNIVCGAPNVAAGQKVVVATVGTMVHPTSGDPFLIKKAKIRGADSEGMICAEDEIGLSNDHGGIIILPEDAPVGMLAKEWYRIPPAETAIHIGLTPNRADANSHIGVARDVCAYLTHHKNERYEAKLPKTDISNTSLLPGTGVHIAIPEACPRYAGLEITGVTIGGSPEWLKKRLHTIGVRSINNVVDITNYVLHEYGQPLHAFDADKLNGDITVQFLPEGTAFTALDGKVRKLRSEDIMICDQAGPLAIGGVFGGAESGITDATKSIFLESAWFNPTTIRRTSLAHDLRTDAATHFEKGVDINNVIPALNRAAALIQQVAGGTVSQVVDVYPEPVTQKPVTVTFSYIQTLSGKKYSSAAIERILVALGFAIDLRTEESITVTPPTNKTDIHQPADIVEEILRIDGLDNVAFPGSIRIPVTRSVNDGREVKEYVANWLCGAGLSELVTNSIVNSKYYPGDQQLVKMLNSLSAELDVMRPSMLESGLEVIQYNCNRRQTDLRLFEFGNIYAAATEGYQQSQRLAIWITGNINNQNWDRKPTPADVFYAKGLITALLDALGIKGLKTNYEAETGLTTLVWKNKQLATLQRVTAARLKEFDIKQDVFYADINTGLLTEAFYAGKVKYTEVAKFPSVNRDLAIVLDKNIPFSKVREVTEKLRLQELINFGLFDIFESEKLGSDKKSLALSFTFQLHDRTLTDAETEQLMKTLAEAYAKDLNATVR